MMKKQQTTRHKLCNLMMALIALFLGPLSIKAQISVAPNFPTVDDNITLTYDATQGNAALSTTTPVYLHTGVTTTAAPTAWTTSVQNWGVNNATTLMTDIGGGKHQKTFNVRTYYSVPNGTVPPALGMVFRSASNSLVGKTAANGDIFQSIWDGVSFQTKIATPSVSTLNVPIGATIPVQGVTSLTGNLRILVDGTTKWVQNGNTVINYTITADVPGTHTVTFRANQAGLNQQDKIFTYSALPNITVQNPPAGTVPGIKDNGDGTVTFAVRAPNKPFSYIPASWNNWALDNTSLMKRSVDGNMHWLTVSGFTANQTYLYQLNVDGVMVADPYSRLILDPQDDGGVSSTVFPNKPAYPAGRSGYVTVYEHQKMPYNWQVTNHPRPYKASLVIYEMLVRDFTAAHSYQGIIDYFDHIKRLGVNAIQLMPVQEFENNDSWGYNPEFYMGLDKYYGNADKFKQLIDLAHQNGISVILDVTFNHVSGTSPLCQMYWDAAGAKPAVGNPWVNPDSRHLYSPAPDLNHESGWTKEYVKAAFKFWMDEFKVDGFRLDLSKGFTQNDKCGGSQFDATCFSAYDATRIAILKDYNSYVQSQAPGMYMILEHLCEAQEEQELGSNGMMLWSKFHTNFKQAGMAYSSESNLDVASAKSTTFRSWDSYDRPVIYDVSHDEERLMVELYNNGNQISGYSTRTKATALRRMELLAAFKYTAPGAKMLWMFDEIGYDNSINSFGGRTAAKPPMWNFTSDADRLRLYKVTANLIKLRTANPAVFSTDQHNPSDMNGSPWYHKHLHLSPAGGPFWVTVVGNFDVVTQTLPPYFQHTGVWYDYLTGQPFNVFSTGSNQTITLAPGEYRVFTNQQLPAPPEGYVGWGTVIPVELVNFSAKAAKNDAVLTWKTASEKDNDFFAIERSFDGQDFTEIGRVKGNGTTVKPMDYTFTDKDLASGTFYYRLRQVDVNQDAKYTKIEAVKIQNGSKTVSIYPNPTTDLVFVQNADVIARNKANSSGVLTDNLGRVVQSFKIVPSQISLGDLSSGIYFLKIGAENFKIIKK
jgi:1,4-alpha-glucan branching enzyme